MVLAHGLEPCNPKITNEIEAKLRTAVRNRLAIGADIQEGEGRLAGCLTGDAACLYCVLGWGLFGPLLALRYSSRARLTAIASSWLLPSSSRASRSPIVVFSPPSA